MGLTATVKKNINENCVSKRLRKNNCRVSLKDVPQERLIIDFDKPNAPVKQNQTCCDYLLVYERKNNPGIIIPLEMKGKTFKLPKVKQQLQTATKFVETLTKTNEVKFFPIVASSGVPKLFNTLLKQTKNQVLFHNTNYPIRRMRCNSKLVDAIKN